MKFRYIIPIFFAVRVLLVGEIIGKDMIVPNPFVIEKAKVDAIVFEKDITVEDLLQQLVTVAKLYARPSISGYKVGVAALGESGNIYLGVNLELAGQPLNEAVHGEQFLVVNARNHGEKRLVAIALSAAPCGHCRQFLHEMGGGDQLLIITPNNLDKTLASLLPESFGPENLGVSSSLMQVSEEIHSFDGEDLLVKKALQAAITSYAPYSESKSGVAIQTKDGSIYTGSYLENVAFNPSLSPLQAALVALVVGGKEYDEITRVVLAEKESARISQEAYSEHIVRYLAPGVLFKKVTF